MANILFDALFAPLAGASRRLLILPDGAEVTGAAFAAQVARFAHALVAAGVTPGDRVAVQIAKSPEALAVYAATLAAGAVFLPLNTAYTADEIGYFLGNATPRLFLCEARQGRSPRPRGRRRARKPDGARGRRHRQLPRRRLRPARDLRRGAARRGRPRRLPLYLGHHRPLQGRDAVARATFCRTRRCWPRNGASARGTCCCTRCRSFTPTASSSPPTSCCCRAGR